MMLTDLESCDSMNSKNLKLAIERLMEERGGGEWAKRMKANIINENSIIKAKEG